MSGLSGNSLSANGGGAIGFSVHPEIHSPTHLNVQKLNFLLVYGIQVKSPICVEKNNFAFRTTNKSVFKKMLSIVEQRVQFPTRNKFKDFFYLH